MVVVDFKTFWDSHEKPQPLRWQYKLQIYNYRKLPSESPNPFQ